MSVNVSLKPKQERFIHLLLEGQNIKDAAASVKVAEKTAHRWLHDADVQRVYLDARKQILNNSFTALHLKFDKAVETLDKHMGRNETIPRDQLKAAEVVIDKTIQTAQLLERIAELETELEALRQGQEQERMYKVTFDLRLLTKQERTTLETIEYALSARQAEINESA